MEEYEMATLKTESGEIKGAPRARSRAGAKPNGTSKGGSNLRADVRDFAKAKPQGWNHDEWLGFLEHLKTRGHNIHDHEAIGTLLERERIGVLLEKVPGLGPQRISALTEKFGNIWTLKNASAEEIAAAAKLPRDVAQRVVEAL
jgi:hypothetical protein